MTIAVRPARDESIDGACEEASRAERARYRLEALSNELMVSTTRLLVWILELGHI